MENILQRNDYKHAYVCVDLSDRYDQSIHCFDDDENVEHVVRESNEGSPKGNDQRNHSSLNDQSYCCFVDDKRIADVGRKKYPGSSKSICQLSEFYFDDQSRDYLVFEEKVAYVLDNDQDNSRNNDYFNHCVSEKCLGPSGSNGQPNEIYIDDQSRDYLVLEEKVANVLDHGQDTSRNSGYPCVLGKCLGPSGSNGQPNEIYIDDQSRDYLVLEENVANVLDHGQDTSRNSGYPCVLEKCLGPSGSNGQPNEIYIDDQSRDYLVFEEKVAYVLDNDQDNSRNNDYFNHCVSEKCLGPSGSNGQPNEIYIDDQSRDYLVFEEKVAYVLDNDQDNSRNNDYFNHCVSEKCLGPSGSNGQPNEIYIDDQSRDYLVLEEKVANVLDHGQDTSRNSGYPCVLEKCLGPSGSNGQPNEIYIDDQSRDYLVLEEKVAHVLDHDQDSSRNSGYPCVLGKCRSPSGSNCQLDDYFLNNRSKECLVNNENVTYVLDNDQDSSRNRDQLNRSTGNVQCDRENNIRGLRSRFQVNPYVAIHNLCRNSISRDLRSSDQLNFKISNDLCDGKKYQGTFKDNVQS
ncbi:putative uncharacterized protein DDB_G0282133 [Magallana gigas]|uniref:putative uncharacterized protein DDB_G0282133 n=1 Tax=Magallana gigas TaxID=29159 RepID=UPI00333F2956